MSQLKIHDGDFTTSTLAGVLRWLADFFDDDEATSYTSDDTFDALTRLRDSAQRQHGAANHIRASRPLGRR